MYVYVNKHGTSQSAAEEGRMAELVLAEALEPAARSLDTPMYFQIATKPA